MKCHELVLTFLLAVNAEPQHEPKYWAEHLSTTCVTLGRLLNLLVFFTCLLRKYESSMNLYLEQDKVKESVSLLLFFQTVMSSLSSPWVQISLVLQVHYQGAFPDSPVYTNLCLLGSVTYNLAISYSNFASQANLRMFVSLALLGPLSRCQATGMRHVGCLLD